MSIIDMEDVSLQRQGKRILSGISWQVKSGEHWAVLGNNGSGKTSLLSLVLAYLWPTEGRASVFGEALGTFDVREMRRRIGIVSHAITDRFFAAKPDAAVRDVVLSGRFASVGLYERPSAEDEARAGELLMRFGCDRLATVPFYRLSQGEKQRALLARAFMAQPKLLLLDEPCVGLDLAGREMLLRGLQALAGQEGAPTLVYVTHHIEEITPAVSHVLLLREGRVVAAGAKRQVLSAPKLEKALGLAVRVRWQDGRPWVVGMSPS